MLYSFRQNTQSGTQWDGLRHFGVLEHNVFYQGLAPKFQTFIIDIYPYRVNARDIARGHHPMPNPLSVDKNLIKLGIHSTVLKL